MMLVVATSIIASRVSILVLSTQQVVRTKTHLHKHAHTHTPKDSSIDFFHLNIRLCESQSVSQQRQAVR